MSARVMRCPRCRRGELRQMVDVTVEAPALCRNLSKSGIRSREVRVWGVSWERAVLFCPRCGFMHRYPSVHAKT